MVFPLTAPPNWVPSSVMPETTEPVTTRLNLPCAVVVGEVSWYVPQYTFTDPSDVEGDAEKLPGPFGPVYPPVICPPLSFPWNVYPPPVTKRLSVTELYVPLNRMLSPAILM